MGLLDSVIGNVLGGSSSSGTSSPLNAILSSLLGGGQGNLGGMLGGSGGGLGGLGGLLSQFENAGLSHVAQSWIGTGPNQQISPQQLQQVFGEDRINGMAQQSGMQPHDLLTQLSQHLPSIIDQLTPGGQLPSSRPGLF
jgi:uncharacterized protein YidB (DUF937 family)